MAKDPAFLFYSSDFLTGIACLSFEERGQYITLLCLQHQTGHLSEKTIRLSVGNVSVDVLAKFSKDDNGMYFNERLDLEIEKRSSFVDSRRENGSKGGRPKNEDKKPLAKPSGKPTHNHSEDVNDNVNEIIIKKESENKKIEFDIFWDAYDKKVGSREKLTKKWNALKLEEQQDALAYIPHYKIAQPDKQYRKNPETFLNNKSWHDEIVMGGKTGTSEIVNLMKVRAEVGAYFDNQLKQHTEND